MHTGAGMEEEDNLRNENKARVPARHPTKHVRVRPTPQASIVIGRQPLAFTAAGLRPRTSPTYTAPLFPLHSVCHVCESPTRCL